MLRFEPAPETRTEPGRARRPDRKERGGGIPGGIVTTSDAADGPRSRPGDAEGFRGWLLAGRGLPRAVPALAALVTTSLACFAGYDPAVKADIDRRVKALSPSNQTFPAPSAPTPLPLAVGQWTQHKTVDDKGRPAFLTMKLVGEDLGSYWLEILNEGYTGRSVAKMLVYLGDRANTSAADIKILKTKEPSGEVKEVAPDELEGARASWQGAISAMAIAWQGLPQEDTRVAAGTFKGAYKRETAPGWGPFESKSLAWSHPVVPLSGLVRSQGLDRKNNLELVAFGEHGAISEIQ